MSITEFPRSKALRMGVDQNTFNEADEAATIAARDAYFASNPTKLAIYNANSDLLIRLVFLDGAELITRYQARLGGAWVDYSPVVTGIPGEVASLAGVQIGEIPYKLVDGTFGGSNMRVLEDGRVLAPEGFTVESGSVTFGEVLTLSEISGFMGIRNHLNGNQYTLIDFQTPTTTASSVPQIFHLLGAEAEFVAQAVDTTNIPNNPLIFNYIVQNTAKTNKLKFRTYAAMTNVRIRITQVSNGVVAKYIPSQQVWEEGFGGISWALGDNTYDFGDTSLIFNAGNELQIEIRADVVALKGNASLIPYFTATLQVGEFRQIITNAAYTATDVKAKLETLLSPNKLAKSAIQDVVNTVNGGFGDVVISTTSIGAQPLDATLTALAAQVTAADGLTYSTGVDTFAQTVLTPFARTILDDTSAATTRATLGLGDMALQNAANVAITGGSITGITDLAIADGGTGASDAATARTNLGLGTIATQNVSNVTITGGSVTGITDITVADGGTGASDAAGARTNLGLVIGTNVQAFDNTLQQFSGFGTVADRIFYSAGVDAYAEASLTTFGRSLIDDADATAARTTLGLGTMAVQNAATVAITGGSITGITDLAVADGGTGASTAAAARTNLGLLAGTYTPTGTNVAGITSFTIQSAQYFAIDGVVTVSGRATIDPTGSGTTVELGISLPPGLASNFANTNECAGTAGCTTIAGQAAGILADTANDRAALHFVSVSTTNATWAYSFTYRII